jgi:hypothetical protein
MPWSAPSYWTVWASWRPEQSEELTGRGWAGARGWGLGAGGWGLGLRRQSIDDLGVEDALEQTPGEQDL